MIWNASRIGSLESQNGSMGEVTFSPVITVKCGTGSQLSAEEETCLQERPGTAS
jgi:hypothetical protein